MKNKQTKKKADQVVPWTHAVERAVEAVVDERRLNAWKTRNRGLAICQLAIAPVKKIQKYFEMHLQIHRKGSRIR